VAAADIAGLTKHLAANAAKDNSYLCGGLIDSASLADKSYAR
jgi:hypothetical protein